MTQSIYFHRVEEQDNDNCVNMLRYARELESSNDISTRGVIKLRNFGGTQKTHNFTPTGD